MKIHSPIIAILGLAAFTSLAGAAEEKALNPKQVPQAVHQAFQKAYPNIKETKYSEKTLEGKTAYEVEFKDKGKKLEAVYGADGTLIEIEEEIKTSELPDAVVQAVKKAHPNATLNEAEKILNLNGAASGYEVEIKDGKKELEIHLDPEGKILKTEGEK